MKRVSDQKKYFLNLAKYLRSNEPISVEIREYLAKSFEGLGKGVDPEIVFGLKRNPGDTLENERARKDISFLLQIVAQLIEPIDKCGKGLTKKRAFEEAAKIANENLKKGRSEYAYDAEYIKKLWYKNKHLQSPFRTFSEPDSPDYTDIVTPNNPI